MSLDLVVKDGKLITPEGILEADLGVEAGAIAAIAPELEADRVLDATGCWVMPGGIDPHVHLQMPTANTVSSDDWQSGTVAAAYGGTTTVIDFVEPEAGQPLIEALRLRRDQAEGNAAVDFGLHMTITSDEPSLLSQLPTVVSAGLPTFKLYTTYAGFKLDDEQILNVLAALEPLAALPIVHAESDAIVHWKTRSLLASAPRHPGSHPLSRPAQAEQEAIQRVLALADCAGIGIYFVHVSTAGGARAIGHARAGGQRAYGETCPQYLLLDDSRFEAPGFEGAKYVCSPPLRSQEHPPVLWRSLKEGVLDVVATDHCPFFFRGQKDLGAEDFTEIPGGLPGVELRLSLVYSHGVETDKITVEQWVDLCCTAPAKIFGLYPRKGVLAVGSDADVVIYAPQGTREILHDGLHENVDYTPYEGLRQVGSVRTVLLAGQVLVQDGDFVGPTTNGLFQERSLGRG